MLGPKHAGSHVGECRAFAIAGGELPQRLIDSCRAKRAIDLSPTLAFNLPVTSPGSGVGTHRQVYLKVDIFHDEYLDMWHHTHLMDSMAGTHLVPPSYSLPPNDKPVAYSPEIRGWLGEYERSYGRRGWSTMTTEQVPIEWTCGPARVIDVRKLTGSTRREDWPASPEITPTHIRRFEKEHGQLEPGEIVVLQTGHLDRHYRPQPNDKDAWVKPLAGESEGWPALDPTAVDYLYEQGIRCVATDAPDLGGVEPKRALMTYWALGSRQMVGVEFLVRVDQIPEGAYFLFAAVKIDKCHGGPGRAIVLY
jgi:kynurenine formamidase